MSPLKFYTHLPRKTRAKYRQACKVPKQDNEIDFASYKPLLALSDQSEILLVPPMAAGLKLRHES